MKSERVALALAGLFVTIAAYRMAPPVPRLDDAFIVLHAARVWLSGPDPVYGVPALVGVTCPAYVALIVGLLKLGVPGGAAAIRLANALGIAAFVGALWYLGAATSLSYVRRLALVAVGLASGLVMLNLTNGMETGWAFAVLTFTIAAAAAGRLERAAGAAGILPFLRPDLAPAAALVLMYAALGRSRREQLMAVGVAALAAAPWLIWVRADTGAWVPETIRAKQLFFAEGCLPWATKARSLLGDTGAGLLRLFPLSIGAFVLPRTTLGRVGMAAIAISLIAYYVGLPLALSHNYARYLYAIVVPWLAFGAAMLFARMEATFAVTIAAATLATQAAVHVVGVHDPEAAFSSEMVAAAKWIEANVPPDAVVLVHDAGGISELTHHRAVDIVGLKTPSSVAAHARWTWPSCGRERGVAVAAIARESGASYLAALTGWAEPLRASLESNRFIVTPVRQPPGPLVYSVYRIEDAGGDARDR